MDAAQYPATVGEPSPNRSDAACAPFVHRPRTAGESPECRPEPRIAESAYAGEPLSCRSVAERLLSLPKV